MNEVTPADVLREAANIIEPEGAWCQHALIDEEGARCAEGALIFSCTKLFSEAEDPDILDFEKLRRSSYIQLMRTTGAKSVPRWNDTKGRNQQEVVDTMRLAAKQWEEENE